SVGMPDGHPVIIRRVDQYTYDFRARGPVGLGSDDVDSRLLERVGDNSDSEPIVAYDPGDNLVANWFLVALDFIQIAERFERFEWLERFDESLIFERLQLHVRRLDP